MGKYKVRYTIGLTVYFPGLLRPTQKLVFMQEILSGAKGRPGNEAKS